MRIGFVEILPWSRKNFIYRIIAIALFLAWLSWGYVIFQESRQLNLQIQQAQEEQARKEARARRAATYERSQTQSGQNTVRNAVDSLNRERR